MDLSDPRVEPMTPASTTLAGGFFTTAATFEDPYVCMFINHFAVYLKHCKSTILQFFFFLIDKQKKSSSRKTHQETFAITQGKNDGDDGAWARLVAADMHIIVRVCVYFED